MFRLKVVHNCLQIKQLRRVYQPRPPVSKDKTGLLDTSRLKGDVLGEHLQDLERPAGYAQFSVRNKISANKNLSGPI